MTYQTTSGGLPTRGLTYSKLLEHLREAQECAAMMGHLTKAEGTHSDDAIGDGWLTVSENLRRMQHIITMLATSRLN